MAGIRPLAGYSCSGGWELTDVEQGWFYAEGEGSVGPVSFDALTVALLRMPEPGQTFVWREGFENWRPAKDVPELAGRITKQAPAVAAPDPSIDRWTAYETGTESSWVDDGLPETARRRWPYMAAIAVVAVIIVAGVVYAMRNTPMSVAPEGRVVLPAASPPEPVRQGDRKGGSRNHPRAAERDSGAGCCCDRYPRSKALGVHRAADDAGAGLCDCLKRRPRELPS